VLLLIAAMTGTREILQLETKQMTAEIANLKAFLDKKAAAEAAKQDPALAGKSRCNRIRMSNVCCNGSCVVYILLFVSSV
jgi:hypothetical protein